VTKLAIAIMIIVPVATIGLALAAFYYALKVDQDMFDGELDFDTVDF
jgi:nitrogen fixation-related uncharacterized protein